MPLQFDFRYPIGTCGGCIRVLQFVLGILVIICVAVADRTPGGREFVFLVATGALITSLIFLILYIIHLPESGPCVKCPCRLFEFLLLALWTVLYLVCGIMTVVWAGQYKSDPGNSVSAYGAACFFAFSATLVHLICACVHFRGWKKQRGSEQRSTTSAARKY